jgi:biotin transporter BioY
MASAQNNTSLYAAQTKVCYILEQFYDLFLYIASGIGALMIVFLGVMWVSSADNSKARTAAKTGIIHVIVGLIIVSLAVTIVNLALPAGSDCLATW